jgi:FHS family glucose/mannose:H+ symporter-like MFS transporter
VIPARATLYAAFVLTGIVTTLLGPVLPVLVSWWGLDDGDAGVLFVAQFAGSMLGSAISGAAVIRFGFRATVIAGLAWMSGGVLLLASAAEPIALIAIFSYGVGLGLAIPATNLYVSNASGEARASALNVLNLAWGAGAVAAPAAVALFHRADRTRLFLVALATMLAVMILPLCRLPSAAPGRGGTFPDDASASDVPARGTTLLFGALLFLYVGTETSVAGWVALYARRFDLIPAALSIAAPSLFWAALLAGRGAAPFILRRVAEPRLLAAGLMLASAGICALLIADSAAGLAFAVIVTGGGLSTIFPLTVARFTRDSRRAARAASPAFVLAGLGGAVVPPLVGFISRHTGSLTAGLFVALAGCLAMSALQLVAPRSGQRRSVNVG